MEGAHLTHAELQRVHGRGRQQYIHVNPARVFPVAHVRHAASKQHGIHGTRQRHLHHGAVVVERQSVEREELHVERDVRSCGSGNRHAHVGEHAWRRGDELRHVVAERG